MAGPTRYMPMGDLSEAVGGLSLHQQAEARLTPEEREARDVERRLAAQEFAARKEAGKEKKSGYQLQMEELRRRQVSSQNEVRHGPANHGVNAQQAQADAMVRDRLEGIKGIVRHSPETAAVRNAEQTGEGYRRWRMQNKGY